jgi:endonuclease/exonuclease/phosphatase (EEP) superfamily protein YafD
MPTIEKRFKVTRYLSGLPERRQLNLSANQLGRFSHKSELDGHCIKLLSWNIAKGKIGDWRADLQTLSEDCNLILIQEAALEDGLYESIDDKMHLSFSPGYKASTASTGVLTVSSALPCNWHMQQTIEPLLRTPKATLITEYAIKKQADTLLVINIHVINFTLGMNLFNEQLKKAYEAIRQHRGPIIFSGDFNTWRKQRMLKMDQALEALGLKPLVYAGDRRKHAFGLPLDHVFYRGLHINYAHSPAVRSSDHNPIVAQLCLER